MTTVHHFYAAPPSAKLTRFSDQLDVRGDVRGIANLVSQLVVHDAVASPFYNLEPPPERGEEIHLRTVDELLARLDEISATGLRPRLPEERVVGRCHHFVRLTVAFLRAKGIPARARCGFGAYFNPPQFEDHWVCEYWEATEQRWRLVESQFDDVWQRHMQLDFDHFDVPRDQFLVAADAWQRCRTGVVDPKRFGTSFVPLTGAWYVAGNLVRDAAALNDDQMLPWDFWGAQPRSDRELDVDEVAFFDHLAALTRDPDTSFEELRRVYENDDRIRVPEQVYNGLRGRPEPVPTR